MRTNNRLNEIDESLVPEQVILNWLKDSNRFDSFREYSAWGIGREESTEPIWLKMAASIEKQNKTVDPKTVRFVRNKAVREVEFRYQLRLLMAEEVEVQIQTLKLLKALCLEGFCYARRELASPTDLDRYGAHKSYFQSFATTILRLNRWVEYLRSKYFENCEILWRSEIEDLNECMKVAKNLFIWWEENCLVFETRVRGMDYEAYLESADTDADIDIPPEFDWEALEKSIDPIEETKVLIALARSHALRLIGDDKAADAFVAFAAREAKKGAV